MSKIRVALIGTGNMGKNHLRVLRASEFSTLKYVVDPSFDPSICPDLEVPVLANVDELPVENIDCAVVASPTETHFRL